MNILDIILIAILVFGLVRGFIRGFFVEVGSLVALALGLYGAIHFSFVIASVLENKLDWSQKTIQIVAFASTFFIIVLLVSLAGKFLTKLADTAELGLMNKTFGGLFGLAKIALILSVVLIIFSKLNKTIMPFVSDEDLKKSVLYEPVKNLAPTLFPSILEKEWEAVKKGK